MNNKEKLLDCINSKVKTKEDYIEEIEKYFSGLNPSKKTWHIPFVFGDIYEIEINKNDKTERNWHGKVTDYNVYFYLHKYSEKEAKFGYRHSSLIFVSDMNIETPEEIVRRLDDILLEMGKQEGCLQDE